MTDDPVTIIRVRAGRAARQVGFLVLIFLALAAILAMIGACQVYLCEAESHRATWQDCLKP